MSSKFYSKSPNRSVGTQAAKRLCAMVLFFCMLFSFIPAVQAAPMSTPAPAETEYLTVNGQPNSVIALPVGASKKEVYAAQELQKHVKLVSGADVPVVRCDDPNDLGISADLNPTGISAPRVGYYPFTVTVSNNTEDPVSLTLTPETVAGAPTMEIRGQDGMDAGKLELAPSSYAVVNGLVKVDQNTAYGVHNIKIKVMSGNEFISTLTLTVDYPEPNILQNPGIEAAVFTPWYSKEGNFYADSTTSLGGNKSIKMTGPDGVGSGYNQGLKLQSGYAYELTFWAKRDSGSQSGVLMRFTELDSTSQSIRICRESFVLTDEWTKYSMVFYNNPSLNPAYVQSWFNINLVGAGTIWMDDFVLKEIGKIEGYTPPDSRINTFPNGSFEKETGWMYMKGTSRIEYEDAIDGNYVLHMNLADKGGTDNNRAYIYNGTGQIRPRLLNKHHYVFGFDIKRNDEEGFNGVPEISMYLTAGNTISAKVPTEQLSTEWTRYEYHFSPVLLTDYCDAYIDLFMRGNKGQLWVDNITLYDLGAVETPVERKLESKPSVKPGKGSIIPPSPGEKPILETPSIRSMGSDRKILFVSTSESFPGLKQKYAEDITFIGGSDGFAVRRDGNTVYIFGTKADGTLNGVYDFIEYNLDVLWTRSTDIGTLYDPMPTIALVKFDYHEKSPFDIRGWHLCGTGANGEPHSDPGTEIMMSRNKLNAKFAEFGNLQYWGWQKSIGIEPVNLGHNLHYWLKQSPYYQSLSDDAKARCWNTDLVGNSVYGTVNAKETQLNFWNDDVAIAIAESVNNFLDVYDINYVGVGMEDNNSCIQVPESDRAFEYAPGKFVNPQDPKYLSTVFFSFLNKVAKSIKVNHPDVTLVTFAYKFNETPPFGDLEDNIAIEYAPINEDMKVPLTDPGSQYNKPVIDNMKAWKEKTSNILVYNYYASFPYASDSFERPIASRIQSDLQFYKENGFTGFLPEGIVDAVKDKIANSSVTKDKMWSINALQMWLYSKLAWNPDADIRVLTERFIRKAYGGATADMLEYYRLLDETWQKNYTYLRWNVELNTYVKTFYGDPKHSALMKAALNRAWNAANDIQKQRILPIKDAFEESLNSLYELNEEAIAKKTDAGLDAILGALDMSDPIWADAPVLEDFRDSLTTKPVPGTKTKVRLIWDEKYLYIAYENFDTGILDLYTADLNSAGNWWERNSDDVETFLSLKGFKEDPDAIYRVFFGNPSNKKIVYQGFGRLAANRKHVSDPGNWYSTAEIFDEDGTQSDRWVVIQAIPFEQLGANGSVTSDTDLYGYFYRGYYAPAFTNIGWGGAPVWNPEYFKRITLLEDIEEPKTCTVAFDANGGSGTMAESTVTSGEAFTLPANVFTAPEGKRFHGWAIGNPDGESVSAETPYTFTANTTVYAVWEDIPEKEPGIIIIGVRYVNHQANIDFDIVSANGKGYKVYISKTKEPNSFVEYTYVNYNAKGVHLKKLEKGDHYVFIEYTKGDVVMRSGIIKITSEK